MGTMARHHTENGPICGAHHFPIQKYGSQKKQFPMFHDSYPNCVSQVPQAPQD